jgi:hypothetical protein
MGWIGVHVGRRTVSLSQSGALEQHTVRSCNGHDTCVCRVAEILVDRMLARG